MYKGAARNTMRLTKRYTPGPKGGCTRGKGRERHPSPIAFRHAIWLETPMREREPALRRIPSARSPKVVRPAKLRPRKFSYWDHPGLLPREYADWTMCGAR